MATTSLLVAVGFAGLLFLVFGEMPRRAPPGDRPWMRDPTAHPRWNIRDTFRDIGIALLTGAVVGSVFFVAEETREDERTLRAEIVENTRFVRQLSIEFPDQPKPLTGSMLAGASLGGLNLAGADLSGAVFTGWCTGIIQRHRSGRHLLGRGQPAGLAGGIRPAGRGLRGMPGLGGADTSPSQPEVAATLGERCAAFVRGRRVIVVGGVAAAATVLVRQLVRFGAGDVLVVAEGVGTGEVPGDAEARIVVVPGPSPATVTDEVRSWIEFSDHPPAEAATAVEAFDPEGSALCLVSPFATVERYLGRDTLGGRRPEIAALEDKTIADELWDSAGVRRAPSVVVPVDPANLAAAHAEMDRGHGTVWSGDASEGMNGGADLVYLVRAEADFAPAVELFRPSTRHVRVMPFLEGVPCSIHGLVLHDGVAVLRPAEQVVLRRPGTGRFMYAGLSTCWDPPPRDRAEMRAAASLVGELLGERYGMRGGFAVDGILTSEGFLPTELNPRFSGGMFVMARGLPDLPIALAQAAIARDIDIGVTAADLESLLLGAADATRSGAAYAVTSALRSTETEEVAVTGGPDGLTEASDDGAVVGSVELGPASMGSLVRFQPAEPAPGLRLAPYAVAAFRYADQRWGTGFGPLEIAPDVRFP